MEQPRCILCGCSNLCDALVPLLWEEHALGRTDDAGIRRRLAVRLGHSVNATDVLVCEDCVCGIKRLPFGDINQGKVRHEPEPLKPAREEDIPF